MSIKNPQCENFIPLLDAFSDGELDSAERENIEQHLHSCEDCKSQLKEIESLKVSLASLPKRQMKVDLADIFDSPNSSSALSSVNDESSTNSVAKAENVVPLTSKKSSRGKLALATAAAVAVIAIAASVVSQNANQQVAHSNTSDDSVKIAQKAGAGAAIQQPTKLASPDLNTSDQSVGLSKVTGETNSVSPTQDKIEIASADNNANSSKKAIANHAVTGFSGVEDSHKRTAGAHLNNEASSDESAKTTVVAHDNSAISSVQRGRENTDLLALYDDDDSVGTDIGMTTDEDGLYAIKL